MRVVYDISVLGAGLYSHQARTGVARFVDNLRISLLAEDEVDLSCCAFHSFEEYLQLKVNSGTVAGLEGSSLLPFGNSLANTFVGAIEALYPEVSVAQDRRLQQRALSGLLHLVDRFCVDCGFVEITGQDIFHSTFYPFPKAIRAQRQLKRFMTVHDLIPIRCPQFFGDEQGDLSRRIVDCIEADDWVVTNSESTKNDLCDYAQLDPSRVFVTPLAASEMFFHCTDGKRVSSVKKRYHIPDRPYVLSVCTLEPRKNIEQVIRSFIQLVQEQHINDLNLVLVGTEGWDFGGILDEIEHASTMKERIVVTGYVLDEDLTALYSGAMMFVYPSFYEGFGLPPLEAMQCGVPVVTSNTSSLPEVVGDAGIMVDPKDGESLSQAMLDIYSQSSLRETLSRKSLERANLFSWKKCSQRTVAAYKAALMG